jgi:acyl-CoA reductase-like NAD-dependent aldehyde dehydrogenase
VIMGQSTTFDNTSGKLRPKLQGTDGRTIKRFLLSSGRGRVDASQPQRRGASPVYKWSGRSPLETANVLTRLHALLGSRSRERAREFLKEMGFSYRHEDRDEGGAGL